MTEGRSEHQPPNEDRSYFLDRWDDGENRPPEEEVCGWSFDHETVITYEDDGLLQWECRRCGAEGFEDKDGSDV